MTASPQGSGAQAPITASLLSAALDHAARGRPVFPCWADKRPRTPNGFKDATTDPGQIRQWWTRWPDALIGMPTGAPSRVIALDVDNDRDTGRDGDASLAALVAAHGPLPETVESLTPRGGRHLLFLHPGPGHRVKCSTSEIGPALDVRGDGGYIILPPSRLPDGRGYEWEGSSDPEEGHRAAAAPDWLLALVTEPDHPKPAPVPPSGERIPEGQRNAFLFSLGRSLRAKGLSEAAILAALQAENAARCDPPLDPGEVTQTAASAAKPAPGRSPEYDKPRLVHPPETAAPPPPSAPSEGRPVVQIRAGELSAVCDKAQAILEAAPCEIYQQGTRLVRLGTAADLGDSPTWEREPTAPVLHGLVGPSMLDALSRHVAFVKLDGRRDKEVPADPPGRLAEVLLSREGRWRFPRLLGHTECPCVTPQGRLIDAPGYDPHSGLFVMSHPLQGQRILRSPTPDLARAALAVLREWLGTFPFQTPEDESAALAAALTGVHRRAIRTAPLIANSATTAGTGKSFLAECIAVLATGRTPALFTVGSVAEELEKRLDAMLLNGDQVAVLDNIERPLKSDALCTVATQPMKSVRVLGLSRTVDCPTNTALVLTGNNLVLLGDLQRRHLLIRLDAGCERPEQRVFNRHPVEYTREKRAELLHAALTIPLAYVAAGRPEVDAPAFGSFEDWDLLIRRALIWVGLPDPLKATESMRDEDHELAGIRALLPLWWDIWGDRPVSPSQIIEQATPPGSFPPPSERAAALAEALQGVMGDGGKQPAQALGYKLRAWQGRIVDGFKITKAPRGMNGVRYALIKGTM